MMVEAVLEAGRLAPYAGLANKGTRDFRRFFAVSASSAVVAPIRGLVRQAVAAKLDGLSESKDPRMLPMLGAMRGIAENGPPPWTAPWLLIVAERRGYPARESEALAHCLENMWLKATALGLGFQMVSALADLSGDIELSRLLGLPAGEFEFDACQVGFPEAPLPDVAREEPESSITWFEG